MDYKSKRMLKLSSIDLLERRVIYLDGEIDGCIGIIGFNALYINKCLNSCAT